MYEEKLKELGLEVPQMAAPVANYVPCVVENGWLYISGQLPMVNGQLAAAGKLGDGLDVEQGYEAAIFTMHSTALAQSNRFSALLTVWSAL